MIFKTFERKNILFYNDFCDFYNLKFSLEDVGCISVCEWERERKRDDKKRVRVREKGDESESWR